MLFTAEIDIMPHRELLDPQGKTVTKNLEKLSLSAIQNVRIGKHVTLQIEAANETEAHTLADTACKKLLANQIMEGYTFSITAN
jgi:phosphoribosylformylglycinamidine synthase subunit PurS